MVSFIVPEVLTSEQNTYLHAFHRLLDDVRRAVGLVEIVQIKHIQ